MASVVEDTAKTDGEDLTSGVATVMRVPAKITISCIVIFSEILRLAVLIKEDERERFVEAFFISTVPVSKLHNLSK